jgi:hypothetical protein
MIRNSVSLLIVTAFISFGLSSCKKKDEANKLTEFDINYSTNLTIPSSSITVTTPTTSVEFNTPNIPTQQSSKFSGEGTAQSLIDEIKMTKFTISATGANANLDFLKSLTVYIKANSVGEQVIATKSNIPAGVTSVSMDLQDVNIKSYIFQDNIQFRVLAIFDGSSATDQTLKLDETVHVKASLIK